MPKFRTLAQNSKLFGLAAKLGLSHDDLRDFAAEVSDLRTEHTSKLYVAEADEIIHRLEKALNIPNTPTRSVSRQRQQAGIVQIVTAGHLKKLDDLWFEKSHRTASGLQALTLRIIKIAKPRTTSDCNKVIEAVKSMNARDGDTIIPIFTKQEAA